MWRTAAVCQGRRAQGGRRLRRTSSTAAVGERGRAAWLCVSVCVEAGLGGAGRAGPAAHSSVAAAWRAWSRGRYEERARRGGAQAGGESARVCVCAHVTSRRRWSGSAWRVGVCGLGRQGAWPGGARGQATFGAGGTRLCSVGRGRGAGWRRARGRAEQEGEKPGRAALGSIERVGRAERAGKERGEEKQRKEEKREKKKKRKGERERKEERGREVRAENTALGRTRAVPGTRERDARVKGE